jgi:4-carboxymuconolactone decarboxylase
MKKEIELDPADSRTFSGTAFTCLLGAAERDVPIKLYLVRFEPGARTGWHSHSGPQILVVTSGRCRFQQDGEALREIEAGESVRIESGIRHWHGATNDSPAEHIAVNLESRETNWFAGVTDEQFRAGDSR